MGKGARDYVLLYINGRRTEVRGPEIFLPLSDYLRRRCSMVGTKVVCAEGDCGACTVLVGAPSFERGPFEFLSQNSCIAMVSLLDASHIVTVEGLQERSALNVVQQAMVDEHGSQCGFCTPGFVMALASFFETGKTPSEKRVKNFLTGNLCRCTGYKTIVNAAMKVDPSAWVSLQKRYVTQESLTDLTAHQKIPVLAESAEKKFFGAVELQSAVEFKADGGVPYGAATDLGVGINKGRIRPQRVLSLRHIKELYGLEESGEEFQVGGRVTLTSLLRFLENREPEFARFLDLFASPQIKNAGTLVGNIANGSPIGDTLPYLLVMEAVLELRGTRGTRSVAMTDFYRGYKRLDLQPDELIVSVRIPRSKKGQRLRLYKSSQRKDLDISCVSAAFLSSEGDFRMALGGVGPTPMRMRATEGRVRERAPLDEILKAIDQEVTPLSDVRGSEKYRRLLAQNFFRKWRDEVENG